MTYPLTFFKFFRNVHLFLRCGKDDIANRDQPRFFPLKKHPIFFTSTLLLSPLKSLTDNPGE